MPRASPAQPAVLTGCCNHSPPPWQKGSLGPADSQSKTRGGLQTQLEVFGHRVLGMRDRAVRTTHAPELYFSLPCPGVGTIEALTWLPTRMALCFSVPQSENSSIKLSSNILRTQKGNSGVCALVKGKGERRSRRGEVSCRSTRL